MRVDNLEKVLERMATSEDTTLVWSKTVNERNNYVKPRARNP
jgi:hypothetical protein